MNKKLHIINERLSIIEHKIDNIEKEKKFSVNKQRLKKFFYTMYERQQIWYKRFILKLPQNQWTNDKYYTKYRFTNVYRELDRTSQWLLKNIIINTDCWKKYKSDDDNYINLIWKILFFRMINNPRIFNDVKVISDYKTYNTDKFYKYLKDEVIDKDIPIAHGAFCQFSQREVEDDKGKLIKFNNMGEYFAKYSIPRLRSHIKDIFQYMKMSFNGDKSADDFIDYMSDTIDGCGRFMAHEFFQDLCYIKRYIGIELMTYDAYSATNAGPGSTEGSKYIFKNVKSKQDVIDAIKYLHSISKESLADMYKEKYSDSNKFYYVDWDIDKHKYVHTDFNFTLNQIEMWLCEFYKYIKYTESKSNDKNVRVRNYSDTKSSDEFLY